MAGLWPFRLEVLMCRFLRLFARFGTGASPALKSKWLNFGHLDFKVLTRRFLRLIAPLENLLKDSVCPQ